MYAVSSICGIWYCIAGGFLLFNSGSIAGSVVGFLLLAAGSTITVSSFRGMRGRPNTRHAIRRSCYSVLAVTATTLAVWVFLVMSAETYLFFRMAVEQGLILYPAAMVIPAIVVLAATRRE
ncbi:hypothetical protein [Streptomyces xantholiticus]|uniref:Integral membrane protein n=1 Tax=Streptomyces xantholiticus TaxID=68285 RepID=A0ABV1UWA5_9ACTN